MSFIVALNALLCYTKLKSLQTRGGEMMTQKEAVYFWIEKSRDELESARIMFDAGRYLYTGFMCHQAIEKALKAYYVFVHDKRQPHEHNLDKLINLVKLSDELDDDKRQTLTKLKPLYIKTRYEDEKNRTAEVLTDSYCKKLLAETEVLLEWILQLMK